MAIKPSNNASDSEDMMAPAAQRFRWTDSPASVHKFIVGLAVLCAFLFLMDFIWHRHTKVPGEEIYGFHAIAGFVSFTLIVLGARALRVFIKRDESFYAPHGVDFEEYPDAGTERVQHGEIVADSTSTLVDDMLGRGEVSPKREQGESS